MLEEQPSIEREYRLSSYKLCNNVNQFCWFSWAWISFPFLLSFWCGVLLCSPGWLRMGNPPSPSCWNPKCAPPGHLPCSAFLDWENYIHLALTWQRSTAVDLVITQQPMGTLHSSLRSQMWACTRALEAGFCRRVCTSGRVGGVWGSSTVSSHTWFLLFHQHWRISWQHRRPCQDGLHHSHS